MSIRMIVIMLLAACFLSVVVAYTQDVSSATLSGKVTEASGAVLTDVTLALRNKQTGAAMTTTSNSEGLYSFSAVRPGRYSLSANKSGFAEIVVSEIRLEISQKASLDLRMQVGALVQSIDVSAASIGIETQSSTLAGAVSERTTAQLPLILRDPTQLVNLVPGVTADFRNFPTGDVAAGIGVIYDSRLNFSINGGLRQTAVEYVDGIDVTFNSGFSQATPVIISPDATEEMKVHTNAVPAEFGRGAGALNIITKSGTNQLHGVLYEFLQNEKLNANEFFRNTTGTPRAVTRRNQYGYAVGGPIKKNTLFFFTDWEELKHTRASNLFLRVPSATELAGDFGNLYTTSGVPVQIYNPFSTTTVQGRVVRQPFAGNQIPLSMIDPFATKLMSYYPKPNNAGLLGPKGERTEINNFFAVNSSPVNLDRLDAKLDYNVGTTHRLMGRFSRLTNSTEPVDIYGNVANPDRASQRKYRDLSRNAVLNWTWTVTPRTVLMQAANLTRAQFRGLNPSKGFDPTTLGGPFLNSALIAFFNQYSGGADVFPQMTVSGYSILGPGNIGYNYNQVMSSYHYQASLSTLVGKSTLKAGFQMGVHQQGENSFTGSAGTYTFSGAFTNGPAPLTPTANTGLGLADFELGLVRSGTAVTGYTTMLMSKYFAWYFSDDWRATDRLTLNLGLRYDFEIPYTSRFSSVGRIDLLRPNPLGELAGPNTNGSTLNGYFQDLVGRPLLGAVVHSTTPGVGRSVSKTDFTGWQPRIGIAYRITDHLVARGGFAKLDMMPLGVAGLTNGGNGAKASTSINGSLDGINPAVTINNPFPDGFNTPVGDRNGLLTLVGQSLTGGHISSRIPYQWQWNFGFEYGLSADTVLGIAYAASTSRHLGCPLSACTDQIAIRDIQRFGSQVFNLVANPFYGIITDSTSILSARTVQLGQLLKQNPQYTDWTSSLANPWQGPGDDTFRNTWQSLQVSVRKALRGGLTTNVAYTWSKNLTNADSADNGFLGPEVGYQNVVTFAGERSLSAEDVPHRLVIGYVYDLPFGKGRRFLAGVGRKTNAFVGGWQLSGMTTLQSGFPLPISVSGLTTGAFGGGARPNLIGDPCLDSGRSRGEKILQYANSAAFQMPSNYTFGNAPRTLNCRADGVKNFDVSVNKLVSFTERVGLELRGEFFNAFNRTQLGIPNMVFNGASFGRISNTWGTPRTVQVAAKVRF